MSYLEHESHIDSVLSTEEVISTLSSVDEIDSTLDKVVEVIKPYNSSENKDTITNVDNKNYTISVTLQKSWFDSIEDFPADGSSNIIYGDKTNKVLYIWNSDTLCYELFMDEGKVKDILVNGESILSSDDKIARITVPTSISELNDDIGLATREETNDLIQETRNETATLIQDSKDETATLIKSVREETTELIQNTQKLTENSIANLIGGASESLDTLKEIEDWIRNDETGTVDLIKRIDHLEDNKVDKIDGKGLSTNDYSDEDKSTLQNLLETVSIHESDIGLIKSEYINKDVDNLTNYHDKSNSYSKSEVDSLFGSEGKELLKKSPITTEESSSTVSIELYDENGNGYCPEVKIGSAYIVSYSVNDVDYEIEDVAIDYSGINPDAPANYGFSLGMTIVDGVPNAKFMFKTSNDKSGAFIIQGLYLENIAMITIDLMEQGSTIPSIIIKSIREKGSAKYVPTARTINNKQLDKDVMLTPSDIGSYSKEETETLISELKNDETLVKTTSQLIINGGTSEV